MTASVCILLQILAGCGQNSAPRKAAPPPAPTGAAAAPAPVSPIAAVDSSDQPRIVAPKPEDQLTDTLTEKTLPENLFMTINVRDFGTMKLRFYTTDAPKNVTNVANLAIKGFYNGLTFHRLIPGFMIQGGDPKGTGAGDIGYTVPAEIKRKHLKGTVAMARTDNPAKASSGCQFYICFAPAPFLDGNYTVIGELVDGLSVLDRLEKVPTGFMDRPTTTIVMESVTVSTK